jgi:hypothetical protein
MVILFPDRRQQGIFSSGKASHGISATSGLPFGRKSSCGFRFWFFFLTIFDSAAATFISKQIEEIS